MAAKKRHHDSANERRHLEMKDAGMISEDKSQVANMPQSVVYKSYSSEKYGMMDERINDRVSGIDEQVRDDESKARKHMKPTKY